MDWAGAIEKNRDDLLDIVVRLFVLAGIRTGHSVFMLPRSLRIRLLALLRPAEFAARRLIAMAACKLDFKLRIRSAAPAADNAPSSGPSGHLVPRGEKEGRASFVLFDPFKPFGEPWLEPGAAAPPRAGGFAFALDGDFPQHGRIVRIAGLLRHRETGRHGDEDRAAEKGGLAAADRSLSGVAALFFDIHGQVPDTRILLRKVGGMSPERPIT